MLSLCLRVCSHSLSVSLNFLFIFFFLPVFLSNTSLYYQVFKRGVVKVMSESTGAVSLSLSFSIFSIFLMYFSFSFSLCSFLIQTLLPGVQAWSGQGGVLVCVFSHSLSVYLFLFFFFPVFLSNPVFITRCSSVEWSR